MTNNSLWHEVSEKEKEKIRKEAKQLLEKFGTKLTKIKSSKEKLKSQGNKKNSGMREDGRGWKTEPEFRDIMLLNAPFVEENFIIAEKGRWK